MLSSMAIKPRKTLAEIRKIRSEAGKKGALARGETLRNNKRPTTYQALAKEAQREILDQRFLRVTDKLANAQISLATGQQFLYKIEKQKVTGPKGGISYVNKKPELVTSQFEIENYLEELAENNGDISDDQDPDATYYFLTTKEPNNAAIDSIHNRVHGKAVEMHIVEQHHMFSLTELAASRDASPTMIDGNADLIGLPTVAKKEVDEPIEDVPDVARDEENAS